MKLFTLEFLVINFVMFILGLLTMYLIQERYIKSAHSKLRLYRKLIDEFIRISVQRYSLKSWDLPIREQKLIDKAKHIINEN